MKIIKLPSLICPKCKCHFKINKEDVKTIPNNYKFVVCPLCEKELAMPFDKEVLL